MTDIRRVGDAGVHTVEGNIAGSRAAKLTKKREQEQAEYEAVKNKIKEDNSSSIGHIDAKFSAASDVLEQEFKRKTVGLVTADDFRRAREESVSAAELLRKEKVNKQEQNEQRKAEFKRKQRELNRKKISASLSFQMDDDEDAEEDGNESKKMKSGEQATPEEKLSANALAAIKIKKNPNVDTSFLPDRERDRKLQEEKEALKKEWILEQERIKEEMLEVTYSYWDGSGHRKTIEVSKGTTIGKFLDMVKQQCVGDFHELRTTSSEDLLYIKEDLIIPQHYSFYDLIVTKARGKSGPLFHFDVHEDVRIIQDVRIEKDESHPGKVTDRRWYEKNKHIFPASRWEVYDPNVKRDEGYTIHGGEISTKEHV